MKPSKDPPIKVDWGKHAKPYGKRRFHKRVRRKVRDRLNKLRKEGTDEVVNLNVRTTLC